MNPYAILGGVVALLLSLWGAEHAGETRGHALEHVTMQAKLDKVADDLALQHRQAATLMADAASAAARTAALEAQRTADRDAIHAKDQAITESNRRVLAARNGGRLQFAGTCATAGRGASGGGAMPAAADGAGADGAATVKLSEAASRDVRDLVLDADRLADEYRRCYRAWYPDWQQPAAELTGSNAAGDSPDGPGAQAAGGGPTITADSTTTPTGASPP